MRYRFLPSLFLSFALACESPASPTKREVPYCLGNAYCSEGTVTKIVDGDTLDVDKIRIRLALVAAPEIDDKGGTESRGYLALLCPASSRVLVDQDDRQLYDRYGRMVAVVWCSDKRSNERMIDYGYAKLYKEFCRRSEFGSEEWARRLGCN
jgi:endonuclease YncB( thermonuclease family)